MTKDEIKKQIANLQAQLEELEKCPLKLGQAFWYVYDDDIYVDYWRDSDLNNRMLAQGNIFLTKEHAELQAKIDRFNVKVRSNFVPDWLDDEQTKWRCHFCEGKFYAENSYSYFIPNVIYYETKEEALSHKAAYEEHYADLIKLQRLNAERGF